jgi:hypothetical protein
MHRGALIVILFIVSCSILGAVDFDWGLKYGMGSSNLQGADRDYEIHYDFYEHSIASDYLGNVVLRSNRNNGGLSQNAGLYASLRIFKGIDSISLQSEVFWHRYAYIQEFKDVSPYASIYLLAETFSGDLQGEIIGTADYLSLPLLIRLNQELSEEQKQKSYQGAFIYAGPSISWLLEHKTEASGSISALDKQVQSFVQESFSDSDPASYYSCQRRLSGSDNFAAHKMDLILGAGFTLKDLFQFGIGSDEFTFDLRYSMGLTDLGDSNLRNAIRLQAIMLSIACRI